MSSNEHRSDQRQSQPAMSADWYHSNPIAASMTADTLRRGFGLDDDSFNEAMTDVRQLFSTITREPGYDESGYDAADLMAAREAIAQLTRAVTSQVSALENADPEWTQQAMLMLMQQRWSAAAKDAPQPGPTQPSSPVSAAGDDGRWIMPFRISAQRIVEGAHKWVNVGLTFVTVDPKDETQAYTKLLDILQQRFPDHNPEREFYIWPGRGHSREITSAGMLGYRLNEAGKEYDWMHVSLSPGEDHAVDDEEFPYPWRSPSKQDTSQGGVKRPAPHVDLDADGNSKRQKTATTNPDPRPNAETSAFREKPALEEAAHPELRSAHAALEAAGGVLRVERVDLRASDIAIPEHRYYGTSNLLSAAIELEEARDKQQKVHVIPPFKLSGVWDDHCADWETHPSRHTWRPDPETEIVLLVCQIGASNCSVLTEISLIKGTPRLCMFTFDGENRASQKTVDSVKVRLHGFATFITKLHERMRAIDWSTIPVEITDLGPHNDIGDSALCALFYLLRRRYSCSTLHPTTILDDANALKETDLSEVGAMVVRRVAQAVSACGKAGRSNAGLSWRYEDHLTTQLRSAGGPKPLKVDYGLEHQDSSHMPSKDNWTDFEVASSTRYNEALEHWKKVEGRGESLTVNDCKVETADIETLDPNVAGLIPPVVLNAAVCMDCVTSHRFMVLSANAIEKLTNHENSTSRDSPYFPSSVDTILFFWTTSQWTQVLCELSVVDDRASMTVYCPYDISDTKLSRQNKDVKNHMSAVAAAIPEGGSFSSEYRWSEVPVTWAECVQGPKTDCEMLLLFCLLRLLDTGSPCEDQMGTSYEARADLILWVKGKVADMFVRKARRNRFSHLEHLVRREWVPEQPASAATDDDWSHIALTTEKHIQSAIDAFPGSSDESKASELVRIPEFKSFTLARKDVLSMRGEGYSTDNLVDVMARMIELPATFMYLETANLKSYMEGTLPTKDGPPKSWKPTSETSRVFFVLHRASHWVLCELNVVGSKARMYQYDSLADNRAITRTASAMKTHMANIGLELAKIKGTRFSGINWREAEIKYPDCFQQSGKKGAGGDCAYWALFMLARLALDRTVVLPDTDKDPVWKQKAGQWLRGVFAKQLTQYFTVRKSNQGKLRSELQEAFEDSNLPMPLVRKPF